jgi:hypothetical protein
MKSIPPREIVKPTIDPETGKRSYPGSIAEMGNFDLSPTQRDEVRKQLREKPRYASDILIEGLSPYHPGSAESIRRFIGELISAGEVKLVKDSRNKNLGWQLTDEDKKV